MMVGLLFCNIKLSLQTYLEMAYEGQPVLWYIYYLLTMVLKLMN